METYKNEPVALFETVGDWEQWLATNFAQDGGLWLKIAKKGTGKASVSYAEALDAALCYGWIDGQKGAYDGEYFVQKFTPRRAKSIWSKINVEKVAGLIAAGKMQPAGQAAIDAARADGRWDAAYDSGRTMAVPDDFQAALDAHPRARDFYATLNKTNNYAVLWRIQTAKKPVTRAARIEKLVAMLEAGEKLH